MGREGGSSENSHRYNCSNLLELIRCRVELKTEPFKGVDTENPRVVLLCENHDGRSLLPKGFDERFAHPPPGLPPFNCSELSFFQGLDCQLSQEFASYQCVRGTGIDEQPNTLGTR